MADRPKIIEHTQLGVETTSGTTVAASKQPLGFDLRLEPAMAFDKSRSMGMILDNQVVPRQEWSKFTLDGFPDYNSIIYPLSGVIGAAVITTPGGGTLSRLHTFTLSSAGSNTPKTFTIEHGDGVGATVEKVGYGLFDAFGLSLSRSAEQKIKASGFGQKIDFAASFTATPTEILTKLMVAPQLDIFADDTSGGLGTTKLTRDFAADFEIADRYAPVWPINSTLPSFASHIIKQPKITLKLTLGNDAAGRAYVTTMRAGSTKFIRLLATGDVIESALTYSLSIDCAAKVMAAPSNSDVDGAATLQWEFDIVHDSGWGKGLVVAVQNVLTAL